MFGRSRDSRLTRSVIMFAAAFFLASCGGAAPDPGDLVRQYYSAIEDGDADAAASLFADEAVIVIPSGDVITGIDAIKSQFIPFDLQFMDRVEFQTGFTESNGKISWTQQYQGTEGDTWVWDCQITIENGKIVEWLFQ